MNDSKQKTQAAIDKACTDIFGSDKKWVDIVKNIFSQESSYNALTGDSGAAHGFSQMHIEAVKDVTRDSKGKINLPEAMRVYKGLLDRNNQPSYVIYSVKYLKQNYDRFNMYSTETRIRLSVAAYNAGPTAISKAISNYTGDISSVTFNELAGFIDTECKKNGNDPVNYTRNVLNDISLAGITATSSSTTTPTNIKEDDGGYLGTYGVTPKSNYIVHNIVSTKSGFRYYEGYKSIGDSPPEDYGPDFFKLGDIVLRVPPQAISLQESNSVRSMSTVRTKGTPKMQTGDTQTNLIVECIFPGIRDINGYFEGNTWYGGLRGIIAQYYRTPFVPLENNTIRNLLLPPGYYPADFVNKALDTSSFDDTLDSLRNTLKSVESDPDIKKEEKDSSIAWLKSMVSTADNRRKTMQELRDSEIAKRKKLSDSSPIKEDDIETWKAADNANKSLAVLLDSFTVSTVPGYPHSINATLNLRYYNYDPFSTNFSFLIDDEAAITQAFDYSLLTHDGTVEVTDLPSNNNPSNSIPFKRYYRAILEEWQSGEHLIDGKMAYSIDDKSLILGQYTGNTEIPITLKYHYTRESKSSVLAAAVDIAKKELEGISAITSNFKNKDYGIQYGLDPSKPRFLYQVMFKEYLVFMALLPTLWKNFPTILAEKMGQGTGASGIREQFRIYNNLGLLGSSPYCIP